ncbi:hypothetical protein GCM10010433_17950 [Streptomyces pulveraceus]
MTTILRASVTPCLAPDTYIPNDSASPDLAIYASGGSGARAFRPLDRRGVPPAAHRPPPRRYRMACGSPGVFRILSAESRSGGTGNQRDAWTIQ